MQSVVCTIEVFCDIDASEWPNLFSPFLNRPIPLTAFHKFSQQISEVSLVKSIIILSYITAFILAFVAPRIFILLFWLGRSILNT